MHNKLSFRSAYRSDAHALWQLVKEAGTLELNSSYFYLAFAEFFGGTCLVAELSCENERKIVGAVIAFILPRDPKVLFVWQIGVHPEMRQQGLAKRMLGELLRLPACSDIEYLQATIAPTNSASRHLFTSFAQSISAEYIISPFFAEDLFPENHEAEELFSIGPLQRVQANSIAQNV